MVSITFALERQMHFLSEKRTELYKMYCSGVSQLKNVYDAKSTVQGQTCFGLERRGA